MTKRGLRKQNEARSSVACQIKKELIHFSNLDPLNAMSPKVQIIAGFRGISGPLAITMERG
jgi:hypothetical protein